MNSGGGHHRAGPLKQKNKRHKTGMHISKTALSKRLGGKIENNTGVKGPSTTIDGKALRLQKTKQLRMEKKMDLMLRKRTGSKIGPPKVIGLVGLAPHADLTYIMEQIMTSLVKIENQNNSMKVNNDDDNMIQAEDQVQKQRYTFYKSSHDLLTVLDVCKVADIVAYVLPMQEGSEVAISSLGDEILRAIRTQGSPSSFGIVQGLDAHSGKMQNDMRKYAKRFFATEFDSDMRVADATNTVQLNRALHSTQPKTIQWRDMRPYLLASTVQYVPNDESTGTVVLHGYVRGKPLSVNQLVHVTDVGTYQISKIELSSAPFEKLSSSGRKTTTTDVATLVPDASQQEDLQYEAEYDPMTNEQTWPTEEELSLAEHTEPVSESAYGLSGYQASWNPSTESDDGSIHMSSDEEDMNDMDTSNEEPLPSSSSVVVDHDSLEKDEMQFPDEFDVPGSSTARTRLARYRGLKSFRTSPWDPKESLPEDYSRLFQFEDFGATQRATLSHLKEVEKEMLFKVQKSFHMIEKEKTDDSSVNTTGYVQVGTYIAVHVRNVPLSAYNRHVRSCPWILSGLHAHENRLSVMHVHVQRQPGHEAPLKSKTHLEFHSGFRRFEGRPIFSDQSMNCTKHKFHRYLPRTGWFMASVYGPTTYTPSTVFMTLPQTTTILAAGTLHSIDADRIILKRILLTGVPVKVKNRNAVIRGTFHDPNDIKWFQPIELHTKHGLTGHIKESLGTHGDFKAIFNKPIQQHDTVCLSLYKRLFPKRLQ